MHKTVSGTIARAGPIAASTGNRLHPDDFRSPEIVGSDRELVGAQVFLHVLWIGRTGQRQHANLEQTF